METRFSGTLVSTSLLPGQENTQIGREDWDVTVNDDLRTLRSRGRVEEIGWAPVMRDVVQSVDKDFHPHDAFARITVGGEFRGTAWYTFSDSVAHCESYTVAEGRLRQTLPISRAMRGFGTHSLQADAWLVARYDFQKGPGIQSFERNLMTSLDHRGASGPRFMLTNSRLQYFGIEPIEVPAGKFDCHHFAFVGTSHGYPPFHLWVTADGHFFFVHATLGGERAKRFDLVKFEREDVPHEQGKLPRL